MINIIQAFTVTILVIQIVILTVWVKSLTARVNNQKVTWILLQLEIKGLKTRIAELERKNN